MVVGNDFDFGLGAEGLHDKLRELADGDFFGAADVEDFAAGGGTILEADKGFDDVVDEAEAAGLRAIAVDAEGLAGLGGGDKAREDHAITAGLAGPTVLKRRAMVTGNPFSRA